jgi:addiction module RelE/StbE family toxin
MEIVWLDRALDDIESVVAFIERENPPASRIMLALIRRGVDQLARFPDIGRPGRISGTRELVIMGTPFIVPYRVNAGRVEVLAVMHGARQWPQSF